MGNREIERIIGKPMRRLDIEKRDILQSGYELGYLTNDDLIFIASDECSVIRAVNILVDRRKNH